eukprot:CAMPEP_0118923514 /NCGR_PEP_ID=MMETSP1169-20130426/2006_1 /TAXON_ID=36882 /ORGANISM="Pyramimonas obovata, Strain CCMP722" /LENGTH=270 /DNA_ID=CAMNT_0006864503 /DNA_START=162 /DNA_END=970 /DNA_ORIENTATION=+
MCVLNASGRVAARGARGDKMVRGPGRILISASLRDSRCCGSVLGHKEAMRLGVRTLGGNQSGATTVKGVHVPRLGRDRQPQEAGVQIRRKTTVCRLSPFDPPPFDSAKLKVEYIGGCGAIGPHPSVAPRRYTLTHNDVTGELFLSIGSEFNVKQVSGWYTSVLRDEVLAEWEEDGLHIHCTVSSREIWWLAPGRLRNYIFCRELPLVLDSVRYAERTYLQQHKALSTAPTKVHFHAAETELNRTEEWGPLEEATACVSVTYATCSASIPP